MSEKRQVKKGDWVQFVFAMPGPDMTEAVVLEVGETTAKVWDVHFELEADVALSELYHCTLARSLSYPSTRAKLEAASKRFGLPFPEVE